MRMINLIVQFLFQLLIGLHLSWWLIWSNKTRLVCANTTWIIALLPAMRINPSFTWNLLRLKHHFILLLHKHLWLSPLNWWHLILNLLRIHKLVINLSSICLVLQELLYKIQILRQVLLRRVLRVFLSSTITSRCLLINIGQ